MRITLLFAVLFLCGITQAQTENDLKGFINKNNGAIRTVQKNMLRENNDSYILSFKDILKNQEAAVKLYNTDKKASMHFAFLARTECLAFLKQHSQSTVVYFEMTEEEKTYARTPVENFKVLSTSEIKTINDMDAMSPASLNNLTLTIQ